MVIGLLGTILTGKGARLAAGPLALRGS